MITHIESEFPYIYDAIETWTRTGDILTKVYECSDSYNAIVEKFWLPRKMLAPNGLVAEEAVHNDMSQVEIPCKYVSIPYTHSTYNHLEHIQGVVPDTDTLVAYAVLSKYPDVTVHYLFRYQTSTENSLIGILLQQNGTDFYCDEFPTMMTLRGDAPHEYHHIKDRKLHSDYCKAILKFPSSIYSVFGFLRNQCDSKYRGLTIRQITECFFLLRDKVESISMFTGEYYNNDRLIPPELVQQGIIDPFNFVEEVDGFTLEMARTS